METTHAELRRQMIVLASAIAALAGFAGANGLSPTLLSASIIVAAQPLLFAAIGEMVTEKAGVLNLGVEGMMIVGAVAGFATAVSTTSPLLGIAAAAAAGAVLALVFGVLTQVLLSNQVATGLALTLFGLGLAALVGQPFAGIKPPSFPQIDLVYLSDLPILGVLLFRHDLMVYAGLALVALVWAYLSFTRGGLILRAVGEDHHAAHALGYNVVGVRLAAIAFGGACSGIGGAYLSLIRVPQWTEGMTAGAGWIALAIVVFGTWRPWRVMLGAYLFGGVTVLQLNLQAASITPLWLVVFGLYLFAVQTTVRAALGGGGSSRVIVPLWIATIIAGLCADRYPVSIPSQYVSMTPYLATIVVLVAMSADRLRTSLNAPASLGRVFHTSN